MNRTGHFFLKNVFLSFAAFLLAYSAPLTGRLFRFSLVTGLFTFCAYQLAAWYPMVRNKRLILNNTPGNVQILITAIALVIAVFMVPSLRFLIILVAPAILTVLYYIRWPEGFLQHGLRSFFLVKNLLVGGIWTWITYNPVAEYGHIDRTYWLARFFLIVIITLGLDLRDIETDKRTGVVSIPVVLGYGKAKKVILLISCLSIIAFLIPEYSGKAAALAGFSLCVLSLLMLNPKSGYWTYFFLLDGIMILHALFLLV